MTFYFTNTHTIHFFEYISELLARPLLPTNKLGVNSDAKTAIQFAVIANECVAGNGRAFLSDKSNQPNVSMGKVSFHL
jgi:anhydro-N-acetylmuramic acid kinase